MRFAVISDIHNNYEAFRSTLADIDRQNVDKICCLGDLLGYGPNPLPCVDLMMDLCKKGRVDICLGGNHDQAALFDPEGFNMIAERAIFWTRDQLESQRGMRASARWEFLGALPHKVQKGDFLFVHGSPRNPACEYIFQEEYDDENKMTSIFSKIPKYCFVGHTHVPGVFADRTSTNPFEYWSYNEIERDSNRFFPLGDRKLIINVGSIGQPRDEDPRSCYVVVQYTEGANDNRIEYRRVEYDVNKTVEDFKKIKELEDCRFLWERITQGR